jgi:glycosyltransferase involved in cell wall biosynthesis
VPLRDVGGVERSYSEFIAFRDPDFPVEHHTIALGRGVPPLLEARIRSASDSVWMAHYRDGEHLPFSPPEIRERQLEDILRHIAPDLVLFWNKPTGVDLTRLPPELPVVYWERGRAWKEEDDREARRFLSGVRAILTNSHASRRFVELRWRLPASSPIHVCPNAVRPEALPEADPTARPAHTPLRLGFAGRLIPVKGACLALHTLAELRERGLHCQLALAGDGSERTGLEVLAGNLGIESDVRFLGVLDDMRTFFGALDCFLCPSLREPFGLVAAEALANGCPVVATRVDGLAEVVNDPAVARSVAPRHSLDRYGDYGGDAAGIPPLVYDPDADALAAPRVPDPGDLADAVLELVRPAESFARRRPLAGKLARERFDFASHVRRVLAILDRIASDAPQMSA